MKKLVLGVLFFVAAFFLGPVWAEAAPDPAKAEHAKQVLSSLKWIQGPTTARVGSEATFKVPEGYVFLGPDDTRKIMELLGNPPKDGEFFFAPQNLSWFGVFSYAETGHVSDNEQIDADATLKAIASGTEQANSIRQQNGWPALHVDGWKYPPFYDPQTHRLNWAVLAHAEGAVGHTVNYNTRILGRTGVTSATLVAGEQALDQTVPVFNTIVAGYDYVDGQHYAEFRQGDKVAEYGLAALVAGGAGAALLKSGAGKGLLAAIGTFLAASWKLIVGGAAAAGAVVKGKLRRKG